MSIVLVIMVTIVVRRRAFILYRARLFLTDDRGHGSVSRQWSVNPFLSVLSACTSIAPTPADVTGFPGIERMNPTRHSRRPRSATARRSFSSPPPPPPRSRRTRLDNTVRRSFCALFQQFGRMGQSFQTGRRPVQRSRPNSRTDQRGETDHADADERHVAAVARPRRRREARPTAGDVYADQGERYAQ